MMKIRANTAFGRLEVRRADGTTPGDIPAWVIDEPDFLRQLLRFAEAGGTRYAEDHEDDNGFIVEPPARPPAELTEAAGVSVEDLAEIARCLEWACRFARGSHDADPSLQNGVFRKRLTDCEAILAWVAG
ncbi:hypothetical protein [Azospirillum argentinense]|uniref:Uncharacterized protein n=1 Tax=Azospirillum argentinense TaxID=2970906 RepID=A0A5B0KMW1_9PROT|nr:hypothetical protein [Azospirillum argentinense]KAA1053146.1 hypothetical protein FH063_003065 [Azospirillum argentinense]